MYVCMYVCNDARTLEVPETANVSERGEQEKLY